MRILDTLGEEVELFGWSYGGSIALEAATERRDLRSVVAYEPVSRPFAPEALNHCEPRWTAAISTATPRRRPSSPSTSPT